VGEKMKSSVLELIGLVSFLGIIFISTDKLIAQSVCVPSVWVDPDGCERWAMDDGVEGYMTPHFTQDG
jgi:hypothetical protein